MIDVLEQIGLRPEDVDKVPFTHLHFDHVGWAFANGAKTFPNARYVMAAQEWAPYANGTHRRDTTTPWHVIEKLASEDELELIDDGDEIVPGVQALVTTGHSPGHASYVITSRAGSRLVVLGDAFHAPAQLGHPEWLSMADSDVADDGRRGQPCRWAHRNSALRTPVTRCWPISKYWIPTSTSRSSRTPSCFNARAAASISRPPGTTPLHPGRPRAASHGAPYSSRR